MRASPALASLALLAVLASPAVSAVPVAPAGPAIPTRACSGPVDFVCMSSWGRVCEVYVATHGLHSCQFPVQWAANLLQCLQGPQPLLCDPTQQPPMA